MERWGFTLLFEVSFPRVQGFYEPTILGNLSEIRSLIFSHEPSPDQDGVQLYSKHV